MYVALQTSDLEPLDSFRRGTFVQTYRVVVKNVLLLLTEEPI